MAAKGDRGRAARGAAVSPRAARRAVPRSGHVARRRLGRSRRRFGSSTRRDTHSKQTARRREAGMRWIDFVDTASAGHAVRLATARALAGIHRRRDHHARAGHRRERDDVRRCRPLAASRRRRTSRIRKVCDAWDSRCESRDASFTSNASVVRRVSRSARFDSRSDVRDVRVSAGHGAGARCRRGEDSRPARRWSVLRSARHQGRVGPDVLARRRRRTDRTTGRGDQRRILEASVRRCIRRTRQDTADRPAQFHDHRRGAAPLHRNRREHDRRLAPDCRRTRGCVSTRRRIGWPVET